MHRIVLPFAVSSLVACHVVVAQQTGTPEERARAIEAKFVAAVTEQISSQDLTTLAWGAHLAARYKMTAAVPVLRRRLAELVAVPHQDRQFAVLAILDALLQTGTVVPAAELLPFRSEPCTDAVLALLFRDVKENAEHLRAHYRTFETKGGDPTAALACGNLLAQAKDGEFALVLLRSFRVTLRVPVAGPDEKHRFWPDRAPRVTRRGNAHAPTGNAPTVAYHLTRYGSEGDPLVANGRIPVYLHRESVQGPGRAGLMEIGESPVKERELQQVRANWLFEMIGHPVVFNSNPIHRVAWNGPEAYVTAVLEGRSDVEAQCHALVEACTASGLVESKAVADLVLPITIHVDDQRTDKSVPLPEVK